MLTAISIGSSALLPAHSSPRSTTIRAAVAEPIGAQWLGAAAQVLLDDSLPETADEKVAALLEAGCPQGAIDSCLKNYVVDTSPMMKDSQWLGAAAQVLLDSSLSETTDEKVAALLEAGCPQGAIDSCLKNFVLGPSTVVSSWYDSGLRLAAAEAAAPASGVVSWFDSGVRLTPKFVPTPPSAEPEGGWPKRGGSSGYHRMAGRVGSKYERTPPAPAPPGVLKSFANFIGRVFKTKNVATPPAKETPVAAPTPAAPAVAATATAPTATVEAAKVKAPAVKAKPVPKIKLPKKKALDSVPDALGRYEYEACKEIF